MPPKKYIQQIRLDNVVRKVPAKERNGEIYVLMDDVKDVFEGAKRLEHDGVSVSFMTDENEVRILPERFEYQEDCILDVILGPKSENRNAPASAPIHIPIASPQSSAPTTPASSFNGSLISPTSPTTPMVSDGPHTLHRTLPTLRKATDESPLDKGNSDVDLGGRHARGPFVTSSSPAPMADPERMTTPTVQEYLPLHQSDEDKQPVSFTDGHFEGGYKFPVPTGPVVRPLQTVQTTLVQVPSDVEQQCLRRQSMYENDLQQQHAVYLPRSNYSASGGYRPVTSYNDYVPPISHAPQDSSYQYHYYYQQQQELQEQHQQELQEQHQQELQEQHQQQLQEQHQQQLQEQHQQQLQEQHQQQQQQHQQQLQEQQLLQRQIYRQESFGQLQRHDRYHPQQSALGQSQRLPPISTEAPSLPPKPSPVPPVSPLSLTQHNHPLPIDNGTKVTGPADSSSKGFEEKNTGLEYLSPHLRMIQLQNEAKVKELETELRRAMMRNRANTQLNHRFARQTMQISSQIMERATFVQNKVQEVLMQIHELHENPVPRLFIVLPVPVGTSESDSSAFARRSSSISTTSVATPSKMILASDQRRFRLHFLCECGNHTRPLQTLASSLNHIHYVEHEGYEIVKPVQFFEKYGAFVRSLSHLLRRGVHCGTVLIPPLLSFPTPQQQSQEQQGQDANSIYRAYALGQETLKSQILDAKLAEAIEYLDSLETPATSSLQDPVEFFDGVNVRQLQAYVKIPEPQEQSLANLYRIITPRGHVKWICEDHFRSSVHQQNELLFQQEIAALGGQYDLRTGRAMIRLQSASEANQFYKAMIKANNLQELDIGLNWSFTEGDLQKFVQAVNESRVGVLALDGCKKTAETSAKLMGFGKKYDPLLRVIYGSKVGSLKLTNMPSLLLKISTKPVQPLTQPYGIKALHLQNVGSLDVSTSEKAGHTLGLSLSIGNGSLPSHALSIMRSLLTSFQALSELVVPDMCIRDDGVSLLTEQLLLHKTLRHLNLSNNGISAAGGRLLAACLSREKAVVHLDLGMNVLGDEATALIIGGLGPNLSILNLESTGFGDKAAKALERMVDVYSSSSPEPQIEYLNLTNNGWTTTGIQSLGRTILKLRLENPPPSSPSLTAPATRKQDKAMPLEMGPAEAFLVVNSMIRTSGLNLSTDKPWHQDPKVLHPYAALTATKESYMSSSMNAQDCIADNSRLKVLRLSDAGLSEGAARYLIGLMDMTVLTKLDLRRCIRLFKPREMFTILMRIYPDSSYQEGDAGHPFQRQKMPQGPAPFGVSGTPRNCLRFVHLNSAGVDDHVARILAQDLQSGGSCIERLDIGGNNLTHQGIIMILDALCQNQCLQHLNLGQNFSASNSVYPSPSSAMAQSTREAFRRFMMTNKTLQILYFISSDIDTVAQGLESNSSIRSLVFDRLQGSLRDVEAFGRALARNQALMRFKVYDGRQSPFLQAFYAQGSQHQMYHTQTTQQHQQQQQIRYVDPFKDFRQEAIKTIEKGLTFNYTLIELQWPEMFDRMQPWTDRLDSIMSRNMTILKSGTREGDSALNENGSSQKHGYRGSRSTGNAVSRGVSVLSTSSTLSTGSDNSSSSSLSSGSVSHVRDQNLSRNQTTFLPPSSVLGEGYSYSVHSNNSSSSNLGSMGSNGGGGHGHGHSSDVFDERRLANLELSPRTISQFRSAPTREQQLTVAKKQQVRAARAEAETHIMQRFNK
ncbi:Leucine-rich repeat-containing protein 45 [Mortierella sp. GBA30]|nr:Leucine-rich repeat-containing protein 45 [Mortierella sp. GBA30]